ncbi:unnamed protein product [Sympodiomycopsis kandeliae]
MARNSKGSSPSSARAARHTHTQSFSEYKRSKASIAKEERKASQISLDRQLEYPLYILGALLVCHALSGTSSLSLAHLSAHIPYSIQKLFPTWARRLPNLAPFASDVPNASHDSKASLTGSWQNLVVGQAGPFRSDAAGFGHPLSALHNFTRACLGLSYALPVADGGNKNPIHTAAQAAGLSYPTPAPDPEPWAWLIGQPETLYAKGMKDALYVCTWILLWTALRAAVIRHALVPLGCKYTARPDFSQDEEQRPGSKRLRKIKQWEKNVMRFAEQSWAVIFYVVYWSLGLHIAYHSPYWFNTAGFWAGHPHTELEGIVKFYYLTQCGFWFHQLIVINVEARRKDHWQMFSHHIITILLIVGSYATHFTRVGNAVLCLMDPSDILLSVAKCLRYVGLQTLCDAAFGAFMLSWMVTRHALYLCLVWACLTVGVPMARYEIARNQTLDQIKSISHSIEYPPIKIESYIQDALPSSFVLTTLLCALQVLLLLWFAMIVRVAYKVITGSGATDTRSDEELSEEDENEIARVEKLERQNISIDENTSAALSSSISSEKVGSGSKSKSRRPSSRRKTKSSGQ